MRYFTVDAFAQVPFGGNPAGVVLIEKGEKFPEDEIMRIERPYLLVIPTGMFPIISNLPDISKWKFNKKICPCE